MNARRDLYAALMAGGPHSPQRSERASALIDAFRAEVRAEVAADDLAAAVRRYGAFPVPAGPVEPLTAAGAEFVAALTAAGGELHPDVGTPGGVAS